MRKIALALLVLGWACLLTSPLFAVGKLNEAPMLKDLVAAGKLPAVEKRMPVPEDILAVEPIEEIGKYGGTAYAGRPYLYHYSEAQLLIGHEGILRIGRDAKTIVPNLAKKWDMSADGKTLTLYLRKGIRWSDGEPFTADDILFWWEDVVGNKDLTPTGPSTDWSPGGQPMKVTKIDDYTVRLSFAAPFPLVTTALAHYQGYFGSFFLPKHYLKQFHPKYVAQDKLDKMAKDAGFEHWYEYFGDRMRNGWNQPMQPDLPTLTAFKLVKEDGNNSIFERNPYYWKTDTAGNQLPYIDRVVCVKVADKEMMDAKLITGEFYLGCLETRPESYTLYKENADKGGYRVLPWQSVHGSAVVYQVNQTIDDPVLRPIFRDVRFRRALSLGINRKEINDTVFYGLGEPRQYTVIPQSSYFDPSFATAYAQYDPDAANKLLDAMGLKWDAKHQFRLMPNGQPLAFTLEYFLIETPKDKVSELVKEYWQNLGIDVTLKQISGELDQQRYVGNQVQVGLWHGDCASDWLFSTNSFIVPYINQWGVTWGPKWGDWYMTKGAQGEEPPAEIKRILKVREDFLKAVDPQERVRLGKDLLRSQAENLWVIGTVGLWPAPVVVKNNLRNIPEKGLHGWDVMWTYPYNPEQFFLK